LSDLQRNRADSGEVDHDSGMMSIRVPS